jgi:hypothetical protein
VNETLTILFSICQGQKYVNSMIQHLQGSYKDDSVGKFFLWSSCLVSPFLSGQTFTLDQALSAPFSSQLTAAPAGGAFAWITNEQGRRNLWVAIPNVDGKTYSSHQLTKYLEDDGIEIGDVAWTRDAESIVCARRRL